MTETDGLNPPRDHMQIDRFDPSKPYVIICRVPGNVNWRKWSAYNDKATRDYALSVKKRHGYNGYIFEGFDL